MLCSSLSRTRRDAADLTSLFLALCDGESELAALDQPRDLCACVVTMLHDILAVASTAGDADAALLQLDRASLTLPLLAKYLASVGMADHQLSHVLSAQLAYGGVWKARRLDRAHLPWTHAVRAAVASTVSVASGSTDGVATMPKAVHVMECRLAVHGAAIVAAGVALNQVRWPWCRHSCWLRPRRQACCTSELRCLVANWLG